ncbi:MAG TPA: hypothetical protein VGE93_18435 [Bryobacteraceae bacterium]
MPRWSLGRARRQFWKVAVAATAFAGHPTIVRRDRLKSFRPRLFNWAAFALALSATAPLVAQDAPLGTEVWKSSCDARGCLLVGDVPHSDGTAVRHMFIEIALQPEGKVGSIKFRLPPDADEGKLFAVGFADSMKDALGNWTLNLAPNSTSILNVQDCGTACVITLPSGVVSARNNEPAFDLGQAMTAHKLMLMFYFSHGQRIRASAALFRFKDALDAAKRRLP